MPLPCQFLRHLRHHHRTMAVSCRAYGRLCALPLPRHCSAPRRLHWRFTGLPGRPGHPGPPHGLRGHHCTCQTLVPFPFPAPLTALSQLLHRPSVLGRYDKARSWAVSGGRAYDQRRDTHVLVPCRSYHHHRTRRRLRVALRLAALAARTHPLSTTVAVGRAVWQSGGPHLIDRRRQRHHLGPVLVKLETQVQWMCTTSGTAPRALPPRLHQRGHVRGHLATTWRRACVP